MSSLLCLCLNMSGTLPQSSSAPPIKSNMDTWTGSTNGAASKDDLSEFSYLDTSRSVDVSGQPEKTSKVWKGRLLVLKLKYFPLTRPHHQQDKHSIDSKHIKCHHKKFVHVLISFPFKKIKSAENMFEILICESHLNGFFVVTAVNKDTSYPD